MKTKRKIIKIDEDKCDGCGACIPNCPEGALRVVDGKARLVSDLLCDGLGACLGECPKGAITIEERAAAEYDESEVMKNMVRQGTNTVRAHLKHLKDHGQDEYLAQAMTFLKSKGIDMKEVVPPAASPKETGKKSSCGCPSARTMTFENETAPEKGGCGGPAAGSQLRQWPVQLHLLSPAAPYFKKADVVLAADCSAYAYGNFHNDFLKGKILAIACPKLDEGREIYTEKLAAMINDAAINTLTVVTMEVPCCGGLLNLAQAALAAAVRKVPLRHIVIGLQGGIKSDAWL